MRAVHRIAALLGALCLAASAAGTAQAKHEPPAKTHRRTLQPVSSLPYIAPWETGFKRFSTQLFTPVTGPVAITAIQVPAGQWWRIVYWYVTYGASAVAANRHMTLRFDQGAADKLVIGMPAVQTANQWFDYVFAPGAQAYSVPVANAWGYQQAPIPDLLWPPGTLIESLVDNPDGADFARVPAVAAVEVYTVQPDGSFAPLAANPLIP